MELYWLGAGGPRDLVVTYTSYRRGLSAGPGPGATLLQSYQRLPRRQGCGTSSLAVLSM